MMLLQNLARSLMDPSRRMRGLFNAALVTTGGLMIAFAVNGFISAAMERATFPMLEARIERVRSDIHSVPCGPDVIAFQALISEAVQWNLRIAHEQQANRLLYADPFSPDAWNQVEPIALPCRLPASLTSR